MANLYYNGLHWCNQVQDAQSTKDQHNAGQGFNASLVVARGNISLGGVTTYENPWKTVCTWLTNSARRSTAITLRLYWPFGAVLPGDGSELGSGFYNQIILPAVTSYGIRNFQVLNELNLEYERTQYYTRSQIGGYLVNMATSIKSLAQSQGIAPIYLGFPGSGGTPDQLMGASWEQYWLDYRPYIKWNTAYGYAFNWLAPHSYHTSQGDLAYEMQYQYWWLNGNIGELPLHYTEYGIPLNAASGNYADRATWCRDAIRALRDYTVGKPWVDIWAVYNYIAYPSDAGANGPLYNLIDGSDYTLASVLASAF